PAGRPPSSAAPSHGQGPRAAPAASPCSQGLGHGHSPAGGAGRTGPAPRAPADGERPGAAAGYRGRRCRSRPSRPRQEGARPAHECRGECGRRKERRRAPGVPAPVRASSDTPAWRGRGTRHRSEHRPPPPGRAPPARAVPPLTLGGRRMPSSERQDGETARVPGPALAPSRPKAVLLSPGSAGCL
ncbi:hypothetical protein Nmel_002508, partial [Mimus melanotis]